MKKIFFLLLFIPLLNFSQAPRGFYFAVGMNRTSLNSSYLSSSPGIGYTIGLIANLGYHETYNFQLELLYANNTLRLEAIDDSFQSTKESVYVNPSLSIGFFTNYYLLLPDEDKFFLGIQAGPSFSYGDTFSPKGGKDVNNEYYLPYLYQENDLGFIPDYRFNLGLGLTGGYNRFRFDLRYTKSTTNFLADIKIPTMYDEYNQYIGPNLKGKLDFISFTVSYKILK